MAAVAAWVRSRTPSLPSRPFTYDLIVPSVVFSSCAISRLLWPPTMSRKHVHFATREVGAAGLVEDLGDARRDVLPALVHGDDGLEQLIARHALEHVRGGAGRQRPCDVHVAFVHGEHHDARFGELGADGADGLGALHHRHPQVHDREVGLRAAERRDGFLAVARRRDDREPRVALEHRDEALSQDVVIIRHEEPDWGTYFAGHSDSFGQCTPIRLRIGDRHDIGEAPAFARSRALRRGRSAGYHLCPTTT